MIRNRRMLRAVCAVVLPVLLCMLFGCGQTPPQSEPVGVSRSEEPATSTDSAQREAVLTDYLNAVKQLDRAGACVDNVLNAAAEYAAQRTREAYTAFQQVYLRERAQLRQLEPPQSAFAQEQADVLLQYALNPVDYFTLFDTFSSIQEGHNTTLENLELYIQCAEQSKPIFAERLSELVGLSADFHKEDTDLYYLSINALFAESPLGTAFEQEFRSSCPSLTQGGLPWESDAAVIETKSEAGLTRETEIYDTIATILGEANQTINE